MTNFKIVAARKKRHVNCLVCLPQRWTERPARAAEAEFRRYFRSKVPAAVEVGPHKMEEEIREWKSAEKTGKISILQELENKNRKEI